MADPRPLSVALDRSLAPWAAEVKYTLRTLLRLAGYAQSFRWLKPADETATPDLYYGPPRPRIAAAVAITACGRPFADLGRLEPARLREQDGLGFLEFGPSDGEPLRREPGRLYFANDLVFASYWLLTGAREPYYPRDRRDNLRLEGSFFFQHDLSARPLVSQYGARLHEHFRQLGPEPQVPPWAGGGKAAAFVLSHDVDYPQIIRWIEAPRLLVRRGPRGLAAAVRVVRGSSHFWTFAEWVGYERRLGTRPAFYFLAQQGSLPEYALGTPDGFYDVRAAEFRALFCDLRAEGCEIGLHASYNAYRNVERLRVEKERLEEAAGVEVRGNRHHYWHLDPAAPHDTLRLHEAVGLLYDSSLAFEMLPGFRRGICHPFRPFHPGQRRELRVVQLPPAWMDDHFDRRLAQNGIADPVAYARRLLDAARATGGAVVVDYHPRGMNRDVYPRYGAWLMEFLGAHLDASLALRTPVELAHEYELHEEALDARSEDEAEAAPGPAHIVNTTPRPVSRPITVGLLRPDEADRWEAFVAGHPQATVYHTLAWRDATARGFGHWPCYLRALDGRGELVGVLPLFLVRGLFGRRLVSVPMRDRGGPLGADAPVVEQLVAAAVALTRDLGCRYLELRSLEELPQGVAEAHGLRCAQHWVTTRLDLSPGQPQLWKQLDKNAVRWAINNARRKGVRAEVDDSRAGIEMFYELFARTRCAMGIPPFPKRLFVAIWEHLIAQGRANLFVVRAGDEPINAMINLFSGDTFIPAYAAPQNRWRKLYPNEVMIWSTIEWAAKQGFRTYDFGADSPLQVGLLQFKRKWGGVQQPIFQHFFQTGSGAPPGFDSSSEGYRLAREVWKRLPLALARPLGALATRQLS